MMDFKKNPRTDFKPVEKLSKEQAQQEIEALQEAVEYHDYLYYVKDQPVISDETYDKLFHRLKVLEQAFPEFASPDSPTQRVGGQPAARLEKVRHTAPMLSLNAVYKEKEVEDFVRMVRREVGSEHVEYAAEPKFDGLSVEVVYENGAFVRGATRGRRRDGRRHFAERQDDPGRAAASENGQQVLPSSLAVRGEVFMRKDELPEAQQDPDRERRGAVCQSAQRRCRRWSGSWTRARWSARRSTSSFYDILDIRDRSFTSDWEMLQQLSGVGSSHRSSQPQVHESGANRAVPHGHGPSSGTSSTTRSMAS